MQCNTVEYVLIQKNTIRCKLLRYTATQYTTKHYNAKQYEINPLQIAILIPIQTQYKQYAKIQFNTSNTALHCLAIVCIQLQYIRIALLCFVFAACAWVFVFVSYFIQLHRPVSRWICIVCSYCIVV